MTVTPIEKIKSEAEAAALAGQTKNQACRFPFHSPQGAAWVEFYDAAKSSFEAQVARYASAIGLAA